MKDIPPPLLSALLISLILNVACGEVIDCNAPNSCYYNEGSTKTFNDEVEFYNVNPNSFSNSGELIFKERVSFDAVTAWGDFATFPNNGIMTFYNDVYFKILANAPTGTPQFNVLNFNANDGYVQGQIENASMININGKTTFGNQVGNQDGAILNIKSPAIFNDAVINWDGDTGIGGTIIVKSPTTFRWYVSNYNSSTIIIESPTSVAQSFDNYDNAILEIRGTTLSVNNALWNFRNATLIFSALNGTLGQLVGNFINYAYKDDTSKDEGKVQIIVTGLAKGQQYQIINGTEIMLDAKDISFVNGLGKYLGNGYVLIDEVFSVSTPIKVSYQANVSTMNNMFLTSNAIISSNKHKAKFRKMANLNNNRLPRLAKSKSRNDGVGDLDSRSLNANNADLLDSNTLDSHNLIAIDSLQSNESFFYNSDLLYLADARGKAIKSVRQQKKNKTQDSPQNSQTNPNNSNDKYHFIFTPFINHTYFYESGNYAVSGLDGGFITAFSTRLGESNTLGTHFAFSYGSLSDKNDKDFKIASANLMLGLNYRLDLIYDMFLKARGDFYYFINEVGSSNIAKTKPNNTGFGLSVGYGKDFYFDKWGVFGLELGLDYKMLNTSDINVKYAIDNSTAESYNIAFYNLLYLDLGLNYYKYFSTDLGLWGFDSGIGIRGNLTPKISNGTLMVGNRSVDISLDNDNVLGYLNVGGSYVLQSTNFNMEFTLRYNGSFGNKAISNGGSLEWRVSW